MSRERRAYPSDYAALFSTRQGQNILEDLHSRFLTSPKTTGIDRILNALEAQKAMDIFNYIYSMIDQHERGLDDEDSTVEIQSDE